MLKETTKEEFLNALRNDDPACIIYKNADGVESIISFNNIKDVHYLCDIYTEPPMKPGPKPVVDHGKVIALRRAGWEIKDIADEMGVSQQTIYAHIRQETAKERENKT